MRIEPGIDIVSPIELCGKFHLVRRIGEVGGSLVAGNTLAGEVVEHCVLIAHQEIQHRIGAGRRGDHEVVATVDPGPDHLGQFARRRNRARLVENNHLKFVHGEPI